MESKLAKTGKTLNRVKKGKVKARTDFFRTSSYGLSLLQHRVVYFAILKGQLDNKPFCPVTISIPEFKELCGVSGEGYYTRLRKISKSILNKSVEAIYQDKDGKHLIQGAWITNFVYHLDQGTVTIELNKRLKPLFEGKPFSTSEYYFLLKFTSSYSERLYELLKAFSFKSIIDFEIDDLRKKLCVSEGKYSNFAHFKKYVLEPSIKDINSFTDIKVDIKQKHGAHNKVEGVMFIIELKDIPSLYDRVQNGEFSSVDIESITAKGTVTRTRSGRVGSAKKR